MWIQVDQDECICCSLCVYETPEHFDLDNDGTAVCTRQPDTEEAFEGVARAMDGCPVDCISDVGVEGD